MSENHRDWRVDLIERYPELFQTEIGAPGFPAVGDGWRALVETAVARIAGALAVAPSSLPLVPPDVWVYAHTHQHEDVLIGATRVITNAKGYGPWRRGETWDNPRFTIEI